MRVKSFFNTHLWVILACVALLLCNDIEFKWLLIPVCSKENAEATNRIILALSYSYIAAAIFHLLVYYCPNEYRSCDIKPFVNYNLWLINESLRQCKNTVLPVFDFNDMKYTKDEYTKIFSQTDFYEDFDLTKGQTKFSRIEFYRNRIIDSIYRTLEYREFISDDLFSYLTKMQSSLLIVEGLCPKNKEGDNYYCNQDAIGECIFGLYEQSETIQSKL